MQESLWTKKHILMYFKINYRIINNNKIIHNNKIIQEIIFKTLKQIKISKPSKNLE